MSTSTEELHIANIAIDVIRKDIKNMHLAVYPPTGRVRLAVPMDTSNERLRLFAINKLGWIKKNMRQMAKQKREEVRNYVDRESHYVLGQRYLLKLIDSPENKVGMTKNKLCLYVPKTASLAKKESLANTFYREILNGVLHYHIDLWEKKLGVKVEHWSLRKMRTKWGSCNPDTKRVLFNPELAKKPIKCIEYVVLHELVHLLVRHHNKEFIAQMDKHMPNWEYVRAELNEVVLILEE